MSSPDSPAERSHPSHDGGYAEWVGRVLDGRYRIDGLLGEGGMGAVFVGEHLKLMKKVAIKVIHPEFAGDGDVAERFAREAVAAGQMDHPHVASATDYGTLPEGGAYLVMQYVRGKSLRDVLDEEGAVRWVRACEIAAQVADALSAAHQKGYVHRDLKPDNVMLEPRDDGSSLVKVLDFGIARVASEKAVGGGGRALTRVGTVIGTPGYMAPEQALGETVDYRADLYSLGLVIHETVTGKPVYEQRELTAIVTRQLTESPARLSTLAEVPSELDELVASLLDRSKEKRPQAAGDVREMLNSLVLGAKMAAVASGEHDLVALGPADLARAGRAPTPLGVPVPSLGTGANRVMPVTPPRSAAGIARETVGTPIRRARPTATAQTALAIERVKKEVARAGVPLPILGAGCAALALGAFVIIGLAVALSGDDEEEVGSVTPDVPEPIAPLPPPPLEPPPPPSPTATPVPAALAQAQADLLLSDEHRTRERAADGVLAHAPREEVPPFLVLVAELEKANSCRPRRESIERLGALADPRALPVLERIDAEPRDGCRRMFRRYDCYGCLRAELATALATLRARIGN